MNSADSEEMYLGSGIEFEETKEITFQDYYPNRNTKEETLIYTLLDVSEKQMEDDIKPIRCCSPTGWDEAVQGWGPFSSVQPLKNIKKAKSRDDLEVCVLCSEMSKIINKTLPPETKTVPCQSILDSPSCEVCVVSGQENVVPPVDENFLPSSSSQSDLSKTDAYRDKWCALPKHEGKLQQTNKVFLYQEKAKGQESIMREFTNFNLNPTKAKGDGNSKELLTLNSFVVLPPVKAASLNDRSFSAGRKSKGALMQSQLKVPGKTLIDSHLYGKAPRKIEQKFERGGLDKLPDMAHEQLRIYEPTRLVGPIIPRGPILQEVERMYWQCSFIPGQNSATINTIPSQHHAHPSNLEFLKAQVAQTKQNLRLDDHKTALVQHFRNPVEAKRRTQLKAVPASLLTESIPPSLMITRVEIPVSSYRFM